MGLALRFWSPAAMATATASSILFYPSPSLFLPSASPHSWKVGMLPRRPPLLPARLWNLCTPVYNPQGTVDFPLYDDEVSEEIAPSPPPTEGRIEIIVDTDTMRRLDLSPAHAMLRCYIHEIGDSVTPPKCDPRDLLQRTVGFTLKYEWEDPFDPREFSEMPDIRLWFSRLDAAYPWLPIALDWRAGELARYAAMLVPHQMSKRLGLVFNPEALELFCVKKLFTIYPWLKARNVPKPEAKLNDMLRMLGYSVNDELYNLLEKSPPP